MVILLTYIARLGVKDFLQIEGVDYDETFLLVSMLKSAVMMAIAAYFGYKIWQIDIETTFLNGNLKEDVT